MKKGREKGEKEEKRKEKKKKEKKKKGKKQCSSSKSSLTPFSLIRASSSFTNKPLGCCFSNFTAISSSGPSGKKRMLSDKY